jgi:hypothetical protein
MKPSNLRLDEGCYEIDGIARDFKVEVARGTLLLVATIELQGVSPTFSRAATPPATTVVIRMDQEAAKKAVAQIRDLFQTMGWPPP